ncbi:MAG: hypothetical protein ACUVQI_07615 [Thermochromatium sp.]
MRAQREAWEARRSAARAYHEQRRHAHHPRSSTQTEVWEQDLRRRRAERQARIDQEREVFHRLGPGVWGPPAILPDGERRRLEPPETPSPAPPVATPPGWDNLWYFRGY